MQEFVRKFTQLNGVKAKVLIEHCLFGGQVFYCDELQVINDDRVGVLLKGKSIYMHKNHVKVAEVQGDTYIMSDGRLTITINVNKL